MRIFTASADDLATAHAQLVGLLIDTVEAGASIGFMAPLSPRDAGAYWSRIAAEAAQGARLVFLARAESDGRLLGTVQLALEPRANGRHRAEMQKLMVHPGARGRGTGTALVRALEAAALAQGRRLIHLDTSEGTAGARGLYEQLGYTYAGGIPDYACDPHGGFSANAFFYKVLPIPPAIAPPLTEILPASA